MPLKRLIIVLENTNTTVNKSTETIMKSLEQKMNDPATAKKHKSGILKQNRCRAYAKTVYNYIQGLKDQILQEAGGDPKDPE